MSQTTTRRPGAGRTAAYVLGVVIFLVGTLIATYPVLSSALNNMEQARVARDYSGQVKELPPEQQSASLLAAQEYNTRLDSLPLYDAWSGPENPISPEYEEYLGHLSDTPVMGQLTLPSIDSNLPIYHGTGEEVLEKGIGHLYGTSLPVGGESTHTSLTGHTGMVNATLFNKLDEVVLGDAVYIRTVGQDLKYEVSNIQVVLPHETESLRVIPGEDLLTLITCTPYGVNSHRLLVTAHRVPMDPAESEVFDKTIRIFEPWMLVVGVIVLLVLLAVVVRLIRKKP